MAHAQPEGIAKFDVDSGRTLQLFLLKLSSILMIPPGLPKSVVGF
jgi:hypothetical protein